MSKKSIISVLVFFVIAFALTFSFSKLPPFSYQGIDLRDVLCGFGPLIGGLVCYAVFKTPTTYSVGGNQPLKAWLTVLATVICFMLTNTGKNSAVSLLIVLSQLLYCFGEEFGWRHYLQSATRGLNKWIQPLLIGFVWFCWHYAWLENPVEAMLGQSIAKAPLPLAILITIVFLALFSALLGWLINRTNSLLFPTLFHLVLKTNQTTLMVTVALTLIFVFTWDKIKLGPKRSAGINYGI